MDTARPALLGIVTTLFLAACQSTGRGPGEAAHTAPLQHIVLFELEDPGQTGLLLADCRVMLDAVPGVRTAMMGTPMDVGRELVVTDYHAALCLGFDDDASYFAYLEHPAHVAVVERWREEIASIRAYDVMAWKEPAGSFGPPVP